MLLIFPLENMMCWQQIKYTLQLQVLTFDTTVKRNTKEFTNLSFRYRDLKYDTCVIVLWQQRMY
ncbi:MAG: hypothetical protein NPMRTHETA2_900007 [Nitrosopumilales archaeon]|nr:MAG: hypothetical protein NPMRTHETA2_900007 [Nitrosopumilales archaeon]